MEFAKKINEPDDGCGTCGFWRDSLEACNKCNKVRHILGIGTIFYYFFAPRSPTAATGVRTKPARNISQSVKPLQSYRITGKIS